MKDLIHRLSQIDGPPGREQAVCEAVQEEVTPACDRVEVSPLGNLHVVANAGGSPKILLMAHMDEPGVIVSHVDRRGLAWLRPLGPIRLEHCVGHLARFVGKPAAVIQLDPDRDEAAVADAGYRTLAESGFEVGDIGVVVSPWLDFGSRVAGKGLDNRVGVAVLIETLRRVSGLRPEVHAVFSVQGQVGQRGARTAAFGWDPAQAVVIGLAAAQHYPSTPGTGLGLGGGPALVAFDGATPMDSEVLDHLKTAAAHASVSFQLWMAPGPEAGLTALRADGVGIRLGGLRLPARYLLGPAPLIDLGDVEAAVSLLVSFLSFRRPGSRR